MGCWQSCLRNIISPWLSSKSLRLHSGKHQKLHFQQQLRGNQNICKFQLHNSRKKCRGPLWKSMSSNTCGYKGKAHHSVLLSRWFGVTPISQVFTHDPFEQKRHKIKRRSWLSEFTRWVGTMMLQIRIFFSCTVIYQTHDLINITVWIRGAFYSRPDLINYR